MAPVVTFLSDFGSADPFVGICHAVILRICPEAVVVHLGHGIKPQAVAQGARALASAVPYAPVGVHLAVVDPDVGSQRRAVVLRSGDGRLFVGPDNGLLLPAAEACGGVELAVHVTERSFMLEHISRTFHGRDVFAPVAGYLAGGVDPAELGAALDGAQLARCRMPGFVRAGALVTAEVAQVDRFGNVQLSCSRADVDELFSAGGSVELRTEEDRYLAVSVQTFADVRPGELVLFGDSDGWLSIAINRGDAGSLLDVSIGDRLDLDFEPAAA